MFSREHEAVHHRTCRRVPLRWRVEDPLSGAANRSGCDRSMLTSCSPPDSRRRRACCPSERSHTSTSVPRPPARRETSCRCRRSVYVFNAFYQPVVVHRGWPEVRQVATGRRYRHVSPPRIRTRTGEADVRIALADVTTPRSSRIESMASMASRARRRACRREEPLLGCRHPAECCTAARPARADPGVAVAPERVRNAAGSARNPRPRNHRCRNEREIRRRSPRSVRGPWQSRSVLLVPTRGRGEVTRRAVWAAPSDRPLRRGRRWRTPRRAPQPPLSRPDEPGRKSSSAGLVERASAPPRGAVPSRECRSANRPGV
jgi:hypothetical protein